MNIKRIAYLLAYLLACSLIMSNISYSDQENKLFGKWHLFACYLNNEEVPKEYHPAFDEIEFFSDKTIYAKVKYGGVHGQWTMHEDGRIKIGRLGNLVDVWGRIEGDILILTSLTLSMKYKKKL